MMDWLFLKAFGSLILVLILIFVILFILKRYVYKDHGHGKSSSNFFILDHLIIQPKKFIYIIKIFNKILVLGISENNINLLSEISDNESIEKIEDIINTKHSPQRKNFLNYLKSNIGMKN